MTSEAITTAIRSVLGNYASPEKIAALDAALRPIYGREAAELAFHAEPAFGKRGNSYVDGLDDQANGAFASIRTAFGVTDDA